nr:unnamed protein product [Callosobruchus chinensis]CAH7759188.1 unnamed protein product [Callosobruchus chinensis]
MSYSFEEMTDMLLIYGEAKNMEDRRYGCTNKNSLIAEYLITQLLLASR